MNFQPQRLILLRMQKKITKAEAARQINVSAMAYGRYESGEREPSFQTVSYIAQVFDTTVDYLYGLTEENASDTVLVSQREEPELYRLVQICRSEPDSLHRFLAYYEKC